MMVALALTMLFSAANAHITAGDQTADEETGVAIDVALFPDEIFRVYVTEFDLNQDHVLSDDEIKRVSYINVHGGARNLQGLEYFTELTGMNCSSNDLKELDLSQFTSLLYLNCSYNDLVRLELGHNTNLKFLE